MKLELKHLAPYLPYKLKCKWNKSKPYTLIGLRNGNESVSNELWIWQDETRKYLTGYLYECNPILRPLSDLTKEIEIDGEKFIPIDWFEIGDDLNISLEFDHGNIKLLKTLEYYSKYPMKMTEQYLPYFVTQKLIEWHFDVFNLIQEGLAIDINTL